MATMIQLLLRLPPALRCHAITPLITRPLECKLINGLARRPFTNTTHHLTPTRQPAKPPIRRRQPPPPRQPPKPASQPPSPIPQRRTTESILSAYLQTNSHLLLYRAPKHTTFYLNSYLLGSIMLTGAVTSALTTKDDPDRKTKPSWITRSLNLAVAVFFAIFATAFFLAPQKMIRTVSLVKVKDVVGLPEARLRFEMKHPLPILQRLPFVKSSRGGGGIEAPLNKVFLDRQVAAQDLSYFSIPMDQAEAFTSAYLDPPARPKRGILARVGDFNRSLINIGPTLWQDVRRMFLRDGMAYVRITGHGNWKIDLQGSELLDDGRPLEKVMVVDTTFDRSYVRWLKDILS